MLAHCVPRVISWIFKVNFFQIIFMEKNKTPPTAVKCWFASCAESVVIFFQNLQSSKKEITCPACIILISRMNWSLPPWAYTSRVVRALSLRLDLTQWNNSSHEWPSIFIAFERLCRIDWSQNWVSSPAFGVQVCISMWSVWVRIDE